VGNGNEKPDGILDRLEQIVTSKEEVIEVDDKSIRVIKWNLEQSLRLSVTLGMMIKDLFSGVATADGSGADFFARLMSTDLAELIAGQRDNILRIISETIVRGNAFESIDETRKWVDEAGAESLEILAVIARQNIRPLVRAIKSVVAVVRSASGGRKVSPSRT